MNYHPKKQQTAAVPLFKPLSYYPTITSLEVIITPEVAEFIGTHRNPNNRKINPVDVARHVRAMVEGRWHYNGDAIRFNEHGLLIDGQHRLKACVVSKQPLHTLVIVGLPDEVMATIDSGKTRTAADILRIQGMKDPDTMKGIANGALAIAYKADNVKASPDELVAIACAHESGMRDWLKRCRGEKEAPVFLVALLYVLSLIHPELIPKLQEFADAFKTVSPSARFGLKCPAHKLAVKLLDDKSRTTVKGKGMAIRRRLWILYAVIRFLNEEPVTKIGEGDYKSPLLADWTPADLYPRTTD